MYTAYIIFISILILSFITGSIILRVEHKLVVKNKYNNIYDEEII